jgi:phosphocarrier protein HPr
MIKKSFQLQNKLGLHARASAKLVATVSRFLSKIEITQGKQTINGKSIMGVMMLGAKFGSTIDCIIEGQDELELCQAIENLINTKFDEPD